MSGLSTIRRASVFVLLGISVYATALAAAMAQASLQKRATMNDSVSVIARTDRDQYTPNDVMKVSASLRNDGDAPIYIDRRMFWTGFGGGLELEIRDEHGKRVPVHALSDAIMPPPSLNDTSILIRLDPGFFYGTSIKLRVGQFLKPGRYSIRIIYKSWLQKDDVAAQLRDLPALWQTAPQIISKPVWVDVTK